MSGKAGSAYKLPNLFWLRKSSPQISPLGRRGKSKFQNDFPQYFGFRVRSGWKSMNLCRRINCVP